MLRWLHPEHLALISLNPTGGIKADAVYCEDTCLVKQKTPLIGSHVDKSRKITDNCSISSLHMAAFASIRQPVIGEYGRLVSQ